MTLVRRNLWFRDGRMGALSRATILVGLATLLSRGASAAKEVVVAWRIGVSPDLDAFLLAVVVPLFCVGVVTSAIPAALVPAMARLRAAGGTRLPTVVGEVSAWALIVLAAVAVLTWLAWPRLLGLLAPELPGSTRDAAQQMFMALNWLTVVAGVGGLLVAVLNGLDSIGPPAVIPVVTPLVTILLLYLGFDVDALTIGMLAGALLEFALLWLLLRRRGFAFRPTIGLSHDTRVVLRQMVPIAFGALAMGSTTLVTQVLAAGMEPGSVSTLSYGMRIPMVVVALVGTALATAALPHFSAVASRDGARALGRFAARYGAMVFVLATIGTAFLLLLNRPIVTLLFERGAWTPADTDRVAVVQACALLQVPFYCASLVAARALSALQKNRWLLWVALLNAAINFLAAVLLARYFGVPGLAASIAVVYVCSTAFLWGACFVEVRRS